MFRLPHLSCSNQIVENVLHDGGLENRYRRGTLLERRDLVPKASFQSFHAGHSHSWRLLKHLGVLVGAVDANIFTPVVLSCAGMASSMTNS
jgi:hypothetical protein